jgi:hypothetical protein
VTTAVAPAHCTATSPQRPAGNVAVET